MKSSFPPIIDKNSLILLLGTMPGEESLKKSEYYAHKSNHFWKIISALFNKDLPDYSAKTKLLKANNIALWDVLACCEREGSLDSAIRDEKPNDFQALFDTYSYIKKIFFTSKKAEQLYIKHIGKTKDKQYYTLPSPSSANARMRLQEKIKEWEIILKELKS